MHTTENKRVVLITSHTSQWYEQAIFVMKKDINPNHLPENYIREAEDIISNYMKTLELTEVPPNELKHEKRLFGWFAALGLVLAGVIIFFIMSRFWS